MIEANRSSEIPKFKTIEEEATFWDTHDTVDFEDEFTPVKMRFSRKLGGTVSISLDARTLLQLRTHARRMGVRPTTLARTWLVERLRAEALTPGGENGPETGTHKSGPAV